MKLTVQQELLAKQVLAAHQGDLKKAIAALTQVATQPKQKTVHRPSNELIVRVSELTKAYKVGHTKVKALSAVNLEIYKGEFVSITGTSGSGKSTLLQLIGGLDKPSSGKVEILGQDLATLSDAKLATFRNRTIGFVFQFFYLQPFLSLQTNIEVPGIFARTNKASRQAHSRELAQIVGLEDRLKHLPRELSGGQMQRAAIARALLNKPAILLADEPTGNLDRSNALAIFALFKEICREQGTTVVVVTHDLELAELADRSVHMQDGAIV